MKKAICILFAVVAVTLSFSSAFAMDNYNVNVPYKSYTYDLQNNPLEVPAPYVPEKTLTGMDLQVGSMKDISDIYYDKIEKHIYITDTGNNRIVILDENYKLVSILSTFINDGKTDQFNLPSNVFVKDDTVYITDTGNSRILCFDKNTIKLTRVFGKPKIDMLGSDYTYSPTGIVVDLANCMYIISSGINQGLLQLDENGNFMGFIGAPKVVPNYLDLLWQNFSTQAQKDRITKLTPTEYTSVDIDGNGFMYKLFVSSPQAYLFK